MEIHASSTKATQELAKRIAPQLHPNDVLALYGDLGSGKTTFSRFLVEELGINSRVQSPTFVLAREYKSNLQDAKIKKVNHIDLYRLNSKEELEDLGLEEMFMQDNAITIIEWPELCKDILPENTISIYFEYLNHDERKITVHNLH